MSSDPVVMPSVSVVDAIDKVREHCILTALSLVSNKIAEAYQELPEDLKFRTEDEMDAVRPMDFTTAKLRIAFWNEYEMATQDGRGMVTDNITRGICSKQSFHQNILNNPHKIAWLFIPPADYQKAVEALNRQGVKRQWEILNLPLVDEKGRFDSRRAEIVHKVAEAIDKRVRGQYTEHQTVDINQKSLNVNVNAGGGSEAAAKLPSIAQLQEKIKQLEHKKTQLKKQRFLKEATVASPEPGSGDRES